MFISCRGLKTALGVRNLIMKQFGISIERDKLFKILEKTLDSHRNTMLILDNLEEVMEQDGAKFDELIRNLCEAGNRVRQRSHCLLMTSRRRMSPEMEARLQDILLSISLENMNEYDSLELLDQYLGSRELSEEDKKKLITLCGQHTLSMALVASRLKRCPSIPFDVSFQTFLLTFQTLHMVVESLSAHWAQLNLLNNHKTASSNHYSIGMESFFFSRQLQMK